LIDYLAIGVTHLLLVLAALRLLSRADLDRETEPMAGGERPGGPPPPVGPSPKAPPAGRPGVARLPRLGGGRRA
jgi:hypothetical protein